MNNNPATTDKRARRASALHRCRALAEPIAAELGLELFDVQLLREGGPLILRYIIDCETGITHEHCERFSRLIDPLLDEVDPIGGSYQLEVSSPGAERPLRHEADFQRFIGKMVSLTIRDEAENAEDRRIDTSSRVEIPRVRRSFGAQKRHGTVVEGRLTSIDQGDVILRVRSGQDRRIALKAVTEAHLMLDQDGGERRKR